jgi:hypothetical protein
VASQTSRIIVAVAAAAATACAGAAARSGAGTEREPGQPTVSTSMTLTGSFRSLLQSSGSVGTATKIHVDGTVTVISTGVGNSKTRVRLTINTPIFNEQLPWAIAPGNCGNGAIAVMAVNKFGTIDVGSGGSGSIEVDLAVALTSGEQYHVEIYSAGQTLADVIACANLRKADK